MHCSVFLQALLIECGVACGSRTYLWTWCFGSNSSKRCLQQMYLFFPHTEEGAFVSDGRLAERRRVKGILNKGAASSFHLPPLFRTDWIRYTAPCFVNKDAASIIWGSRYLALQGLVKTASCIKALTAMLWLNGLGGDKLTEPYQHFECTLLERCGQQPSENIGHKPVVAKTHLEKGTYSNLQILVSRWWC